MPTQDDVRRIALSLPETTEAATSFAFDVAGKGFLWVYPERIHPRKARVPNPEAIVIRISGEEEKETLLTANPEVYYTTDHYNGYPAILVHLSKIDPDELEDLIIDAWYLKAPKRLQKDFDRNQTRNSVGEDIRSACRPYVLPAPLTQSVGGDLDRPGRTQHH